MAVEEVNGDVVRYTVKELLKEIRDGMAGIVAASQAHDVRIARLEYTVAEHGVLIGSTAPQLTQLTKIIDTQAEVKAALNTAQTSKFSRREKIAAAVLAGLTLITQFLPPDLVHNLIH